MGRFLQLEVKAQPKLVCIGKVLRHSMKELQSGNNQLGAFWDECFETNAFAPLEAQADYVYDDSYVGLMCDWERGDDYFSYIIGMMMREGASVPEGYETFTLEACDVGVGWIEGKDVADVCSHAHEFTQKAIEDAGHKCEKLTWCMELYNCPRFTTPDKDGYIVLDYLIPLDSAR